MKWFYNKSKQGVIAKEMPEGYHYDFRGKDLSRNTTAKSAEQKNKNTDEFESIKEQYRKKFGRKPNGNAKKETIIKALSDDS